MRKPAALLIPGFFSLILSASSSAHIMELGGGEIVQTKSINNPVIRRSSYAIFGDGSVSYNQPASTLFGYNGYCGVVVWANLVTMYTGLVYDTSYFKHFSKGDLTPGLRPDTLTAALNAATRRAVGIAWLEKHFSEETAWTNLKALLNGYYFAYDSTPAVQADMQTAPLSVLIQGDEKALHWVTVVGLRDHEEKALRYVLVNEDGEQMQLRYDEFMTLWAFKKKDNAVMSMLRSGYAVKPFTAIVPTRL